MLPRPLRLLWDTSLPGGVVLSSFRSRDPEEGGGPGGQGVGGGQEEEEEEEEEVRCGWWEVGGYMLRRLHLSFRVLSLLFCLVISAPLAGYLPGSPLWGVPAFLWSSVAV